MTSKKVQTKISEGKLIFCFQSAYFPQFIGHNNCLSHNVMPQIKSSYIEYMRYIEYMIEFYAGTVTMLYLRFAGSEGSCGARKT